MGLFSSLFSRSAEGQKAAAPGEEKAAGVHTFEGRADSLFGWMGYRSSAGVSVTTSTALQVPAVFSAVRVISEGVAAMPVVLKERNLTGEGRWKTRVVRQHWAGRLLAVRPNSWQTPGEFIEGMTLVAALTGQALAIKNTVRGQVRELLPVPPGAWTVEQGADRSLVYKVHHSPTSHDTFTQDQVMVLRGPGLNGYEGLPVLKLAKEAVGLSASLAAQQAIAAENGGRPSGVLTAPPAELSPEALQRMATTWKAKFGPGGPGGIAILDNGWGFTPIATSAVDSQVLESRRFQIEEIARAFRVLPLMIMQADKASTFASVEQMSRMHVTHTLMPWVRRWEETLVRDVLASSESLFFDFDERLLLRGDHKDQAEFFQKALGSGGIPGFMSVNEVRDDLGLSPVEEDWADQIPRGSQSENLNSAPSPSGQERPAGVSADEAV